MVWAWYVEGLSQELLTLSNWHLSAWGTSTAALRWDNETWMSSQAVNYGSRFGRLAKHWGCKLSFSCNVTTRWASMWSKKALACQLLSSELDHNSTPQKRYFSQHHCQPILLQPQEFPCLSLRLELLLDSRPLPIGSMYGIFTYIWFILNVGKYTIHGSYGLWL